MFIYNSNSKFVPMLDEAGIEVLYKSGVKKGQKKMEEVKQLKLVKDWTNNANTEHYLDRVHSTLSIFKNVLDMTQFICYKS